MKTWRWTDPVYGVRVHLVCANLADLKTWLVKTFKFDTAGAAAAAGRAGCPRGRSIWVTNDEGAELVLFFYEDFAWTAGWLAIVAHEAVHGARYVLRSRGVRWNEGSEEAFTYYVEYLCRETMERLITRRGKKAKA